MPSPISLTELAEALKSGNSVVLDVRSMDAWNGWQLGDEARGGHAMGAVPFPARWLEELEGVNLTAELASRGAAPGSSVVVYGYGRDDAAAAAEKLEALGHGPVRVFEGGLAAWAADPNRPMSGLTRFRQLVHADWVAKLLEGGNPAHHDGRRSVLAHVAFDNRADYDEGHIPGAVFLDTLLIERPEDWNRRTPEELEAALSGLGITHDTTVVVYGRTGRPTMDMPHPGRAAGQIAARRVAWLLMYAGVQDVRVLHGGVGAWLRSGRTLTTEETKPVPVPEFGVAVPARPELIVDTPEAKEMLASPNADLVSMRSWEEFIGEFSGYHYVGPKGRIPGAVFGNCGSDAYHMENYRNHDQTMMSYHEIESRWAEAGVTVNKHVAFYCGTGWRASEAAFCAHLMGWGRVSVYDDGWFVWSMDETNPIARGIPDRYEGTGRPPGLLRADPVSEESMGEVVAGVRPDRPPEDCSG
ncbi:MAG TPA: rhodanese-like domain-containing protein [bacterium]|nr:rhodanese-like domain-containing protein [bacterium]